MDRKKYLPIGVDDFKEIIEENYYFVDKSLLIKDLLEYREKVTLVTRPRRFGKTLNISMLKYFFEKTDKNNNYLFKDLQIYKNKEIINKYCGNYPVISLTFKDIKCNTWEESYAFIKNLIAKEYTRHDYILKSCILEPNEKEIFNNILLKKAAIDDYTLSLLNLSEYLQRYYNQKVILLIDEYDVPIQSGFMHNFYDKVIEFFRNFLSAALKGNINLEFGLLTGIIRVAKENIFSGLNNVKVYTVLDERYSSYFGFTEKEVEQLLAYYGNKEKISEVKEWYDGYIFGKTEIYNPWSVLNYITEDYNPSAYWLNTSSNDLIKDLLNRLQKKQIENLKSLLKGEEIETTIYSEITYKDIENDSYNNIYSFLLISGYLKAINTEKIRNKYKVNLKIPNKELECIFEDEILNNIDSTISSTLLIKFTSALLDNKVDIMKQCLDNILMNTTSNFDKLESFYHGMVLGMLVNLKESYIIRSNIESGNGRYDIAIIPKDKNKVGFILEFKVLKKKENVDNKLEEALKQIDEKRYSTELVNIGIKNIIKYGIVFFDKKAFIKSKGENIKLIQNKELENKIIPIIKGLDANIMPDILSNMLDVSYDFVKDIQKCRENNADKSYERIIEILKKSM